MIPKMTQTLKDIWCRRISKFSNIKTHPFEKYFLYDNRMQKKGERKPSPSQRFPTQVLTYRFKGLEKSSQPMAPLAIVFCFQ